MPEECAAVVIRYGIFRGNGFTDEFLIPNITEATPDILPFIERKLERTHLIAKVVIVQ